MRTDKISSFFGAVMLVAGTAMAGCIDVDDSESIEQAGGPVVVQIGPSGTTADQFPAFTWSASGGDYGPYRLWVDGYFDHTYTAAELGCPSGGTCTSPNISLPAATTTDWFVYSTVTDTWYGPMYFTTGTGSPVPPAPTLLGPSGSSPNSGPVFTWTASAATEVYRLWIDGLYDNTFTPAQLGCASTSTCTTPSISLPSGALANWYVNASNGLGGNWSSGMVFTVGPMASATLIAPTSGTSADTGPVFSWNAAPGGLSYRLWIEGLYDQTVSAASLGCSGGGVCTTGQVSLPAGATAHWYVQSLGTGADNAWSSGAIFTVGSTPPIPAAATLLGPSGSSTTTGPVFTWTGSSAATTYRLWIDGLYDNTFSASSLGCSAGGTCTTSPIQLPAGASANWYVNSSNTSGDTWSSGMLFTVGNQPAATTQIAPVGSTSSPAAFSWSATADADSYRLWVEGNWDATYTPEELGCSSGTCTTPAITVASGTWVWFVQTANENGGTWSNGRVIVVP